MQPERVTLRIENGIALIALARPAQHNAVDFAMLDRIAAIQRQLRRAREVRGAIIHGEGPSFSAGLDFKSAMGSKTNLLRAVLALLSPRRNLFQRWSLGWRDLPFPVIAAIHGHCYGAGLQLALGADWRIAAPSAKLSLMEAKWGLVPDMGGPTLIRALMPLDAAADLIFSARVIDAAEAARLGLVSALAEDPLAAAREKLAAWTERSPDSLAAGKFLLRDAWTAPEGGALAAERRWQRRILGRANQRRAMRIGAGQPGSFGPRGFDR